MRCYCKSRPSPTVSIESTAENNRARRQTHRLSRRGAGAITGRSLRIAVRNREMAMISKHFVGSRHLTISCTAHEAVRGCTLKSSHLTLARRQAEQASETIFRRFLRSTPEPVQISMHGTAPGWISACRPKSVSTCRWVFTYVQGRAAQRFSAHRELLVHRHPSRSIMLIFALARQCAARSLQT